MCVSDIHTTEIAGYLRTGEGMYEFRKLWILIVVERSGEERKVWKGVGGRKRDGGFLDGKAMDWGLRTIQELEWEVKKKFER